MQVIENKTTTSVLIEFFCHFFQKYSIRNLIAAYAPFDLLPSAGEPVCFLVAPCHLFAPGLPAAAGGVEGSLATRHRFSNRQTCDLLEHGVTPTKQILGPRPNRQTYAFFGSSFLRIQAQLTSGLCSPSRSKATPIAATSAHTRPAVL